MEVEGAKGSKGGGGGGGGAGGGGGGISGGSLKVDSVELGLPLATLAGWETAMWENPARLDWGLTRTTAAGFSNLANSAILRT